MKDLELYLHIPFCVRKCNYCDFLSAPAERQVQNAYMEALLAEIRGCGEELRRSGDAPERRVTSVFIGGGTPSVVEAEWIVRLMAAVRENFRLEPDAEVTMEMNPATAAREGLALYREAGVSRLSIGMQSADDAELARLGRVHNFGQFLDTYHMARETGFRNVNVDLMAALPGQTAEGHRKNLQAVLRLDPVPEHISVYSLIVEEGTPFYEMRGRGQFKLPDEDTERRMYWDTVRLLEEAGFEHYEISNYARPGCRCRHNCGYWRRTDYLGFGIGAASLINNMRYSNAGGLEEYMEHPLDCRTGLQRLKRADIMEETMFLGLRMTEGVSEADFYARFGEEMDSVYREVIAQGIRDGLLEWREQRDTARSGRRLALTPRGIDLSNYIMAEFLL